MLQHLNNEENMKSFLKKILIRLASSKTHYAVYKNQQLVVYFDKENQIPNQYKNESYEIKTLVEI